MSGRFSRNKGQRAEREIIRLLQPPVDIAYSTAGHVPPQLARNLMQSRFGGFDVVGLNWLALEIKFQESLHLAAWWEQTKRQANLGREPILVYRRKHSRWRVMMFGLLPFGERAVRAPVDIAVDVFLAYFEQRLQTEVAKFVAVR